MYYVLNILNERLKERGDYRYRHSLNVSNLEGGMAKFGCWIKISYGSGLLHDEAEV
jgi:hypothetical protein